ncbi:MAG: glycosyltransferase family protein [Anaerolineae bacterium]
MHSPKRRIALYSHDTQGLGHIRRNLAIAQALIEADPDTVILMVAGAREANAFVLPPGVDCLTLPALSKNGNGRYGPRSLRVSLKGLIALRSNIIRAALESFKPDVLLVDKVPVGAFGELRESLEYLRNRGRTRCVLGLREILDDPDTVRQEWHLAGNEAAIRAYYDAVWVYGDPRVYDPVREYQLSGAVAAKVRYTGYLDRYSRSDLHPAGGLDSLAGLDLPPGRLALCLVGGGQDGYRLADAFLGADLPPGANGLVVTGPFMPSEARQALQDRIADQPRRRLLEFVGEPEHLLRMADSVIAMGGYNTICELLSLEKRALIVPRVTPRQEQLIRAERLRDLELLDMLHPADLSSQALTAWLAGNASKGVKVQDRIDLHGLVRLPALLDEVLARSRHGSSRWLWQPESKSPSLFSLELVTSVPPKEVKYVIH